VNFVSLIFTLRRQSSNDTNRSRTWSSTAHRILYQKHRVCDF